MNDYTYTVTGLNNGTEYTFQVRAYIDQPAANDPAVDAAGGAGAEVTVTPGAPAALGPVNSVDGYRAIRLDWADPMDSTITKYQYRVAPGLRHRPLHSEVERRTERIGLEIYQCRRRSRLAFLVDMTTGTTGENAESAAPLADSTDYSLYLRAVNDNGAGPASMEVTETTPADNVSRESARARKASPQRLGPAAGT